MKLLPLKIACPVCNSETITYTCEPKCCFNHICDSCYTTFQLLTETIGGDIGGMDIQIEEKDPLAPTTACAKCDSLNVYILKDKTHEDDRLVCASCNALLKLVIDSIDLK
jgi:transposase-like protein